MCRLTVSKQTGVVESVKITSEKKEGRYGQSPTIGSLLWTASSTFGPPWSSLCSLWPNLQFCKQFWAEWNGEFGAGRHTTHHSYHPGYPCVRTHRCGCRRRGA